MNRTTANISSLLLPLINKCAVPSIISIVMRCHRPSFNLQNNHVFIADELIIIRNEARIYVFQSDNIYKLSNNMPVTGLIRKHNGSCTRLKWNKYKKI